MIQIDNILQNSCKYHKLSILPQWAIVDGRWKVNLTRDAIKKIESGNINYSWQHSQ